MYIGKVIGTVVATIKISHLEARKLLVVDQLDLQGQETTVLVIDEGNGARQILGLDPGAIRAVIVGVVDEVTLSQ
jgi:microcompartment protein CcmK/EutM